MMKKVFDVIITMIIWLAMQAGTFFIGMIVNVYMYYICDGWYPEDIWLGILFVALNVVVTLKKMYKQRTNK